MSRGQYRYDYGDTAKLTPLVKMHTLGHSFMPPGIHAGGLRYHGMAPMVSLTKELGLIEAAAFHQIECFEAAQLFAATEGIIPAPESSHAIRGAIVEALRCKETGQEKCILFNLSGHGLCDMGSYEKFFAGPPGGLRLSAGEDRGRLGRVAGAGVIRHLSPGEDQIADCRTEQDAEEPDGDAAGNVRRCQDPTAVAEQLQGLPFKGRERGVAAAEAGSQE